MGFYIVGTDLGGTKIATALTDTDSKILKYDTYPTHPERGAERIVEEMADSILRVTEGLPREAVLGVGVACAGLVTSDGIVEYSPNLGWCRLPLRDLLEQRLPWKVYLQNDVNMAALGEWHYGVAKNHRHVVCLFVGTGIGGGLILDGRLYVGSQGFAGETGHTSIWWNGPLDSCGNLGCIESLASGTAMTRRARELILEGRGTRMMEIVDGSLDELRVEVIAQAAGEGDAAAREIIQTTGEYLSTAVANLINLLNPELVVLGGGVIRGIPDLIRMVREGVDRRALQAPARGVEIVEAQFGREAPAIGATVLVKLAGKLD